MTICSVCEGPYSKNQDDCLFYGKTKRCRKISKNDLSELPTGV
jgi:hypothetical protein